MKATILVDNQKSDDLGGEWGLSFLIEAGGKKILLDTGESSLFLKNASKMNIDISKVDYAVLSHAHYDHANGIETFFNHNSKAKFYFRKQVEENCYLKLGFFKQYIGIPKNIMHKYENRIERVTGDFELFENVYLVPHYTKNRQEIGKQNHMYIKRDGRWFPDDFAHEQSLVIDTKEGLVIFNSCSHTGANHIIDEVSKRFKKNVRMMIGGFHISKKRKNEVIALSKALLQTGVKEIYTGHCTGKKSFQVLQKELGNTVHQLKSGMVIEF